MHISELRIRNFRNFFDARFRFEKGVNTLIGENGSGKTNVLHALRLLLDDTLARNAGQMRENDFCRALGDWRGHWILIAADFADLDASEGCQLLRHTAAHMDASETGTCTMIFRPKRPVRVKLFEMNENNEPKTAIATYLKSVTIDDYEAVVTGRGKGDFLDAAVYKAMVGDLGELSFPDPDADDQEALGVRIHGIESEVTCTFVQALRDVVSDLRGYRSNPLLALLRGTESTIMIEDAASLTSAVASLNSQISSLAEVKRIATGVQRTLHETVGHTYSPSVSVESALPDTLEKLVQRLTVKVGDDPNPVYRGDLVEQSLGGANLIYLALKLLEFEVKRSGERVAHFLLIEEPEAHIHTHIQKTLFEKQANLKTQVIVSTHSTHISSAARIRSVNILSRSRDHAEVYQPASGLAEVQIVRMERYLDAVRTTLLFAKGVLLVEGEAELVMIPALLQAVFGTKPDELGVSVVSMDSAFFDHVAVMFHDDRVRRSCAIATDMDAALVQLPDDVEEDNASQRRARRAQDRGRERRDRLEASTANNRWVRAFFAEHTFEVDFIAAGNFTAIADLIPEAYASEGKRQQARTDIESPNVESAGLRTLKMAERIGKGWFALLLAERVTVDTVMPEYLLRAVAFAAGRVSNAAFKRMVLHRLRNREFNTAQGEVALTADELDGLTPDDALTKFVTTAPDDILSKFVRYSIEYQVE